MGAIVSLSVVTESRSASRYVVALVVGCLALAAAVGWGLGRVGSGIENRNDGVVTVRGTAQRNVKADRAVWKLTITNSGATPADALAGVAAGVEAMSAFFSSNSVPADAVTLGSVSTFANKEYINGNATGVVLSYEASREVTLRLDDVDKVAELSSNLGEVLAAGVQVSTGGPEYYLASLATLRPGLLSDAMVDAQNRAETLIKAVNGTVGSVRGVNSGPFQVTAADATDVESGGYYDTASIEKTVVATVTVDFETR